ncbi:MAG TPA: hypothetical protein VLF20_05940, partial [Patescibacteria group bacterium]|nr:hypothetical protein [Patescibacteria group bacterium]
VEKQTIEIKPYQKQPRANQDTTEKPLKEAFHYTVDTTTPNVFTFGASSTILDFGQLSATNPVIRKLSLLVTSPYGFQIFTAANHPLETETKHLIPDTTCDNGSCSDITPALWANALTYGYGYRLDSMETAYFRQTPDLSRNELPVLMLEQSSAEAQNIPLTYKVTISGTQEKGKYNNIIFFLATPNY